MITRERANELQPVVNEVCKALKNNNIKTHEMIFIIAYVYAGTTSYMNPMQSVISQILFQEEIERARKFFREQEQE